MLHPPTVQSRFWPPLVGVPDAAAAAQYLGKREQQQNRSCVDLPSELAYLGTCLLTYALAYLAPSACLLTPSLAGCALAYHVLTELLTRCL